MSTQGEFTIVAEEVIDDDLTLLLARGDGVPRLGIFNTYSEKKKYVPLSWVEGAGRSLKIKVGKSTKEYSMDMIVEGVGELIKNGSDKISLGSLAWRGVQVLGDLIHMPKTARSDADLNLIQESKKDTLWFVYTPKRGNWRIKPCFLSADQEKPILEKYVEGDKPWPAIQQENGSLSYTLRNLPCAKELIIANPARWTSFMLPVSKAVLLGFSDWSGSGEHVFSDALWKYLPQQNYRSEESCAAMASAAKMFMSKIIAYLRLWPALARTEVELLPDGVKAGEERGWKKRERFQIVAQHLGDKRFSVTKFVEEGRLVAFCIVPEARQSGEKDKMISLGEDLWDACVDACALGGERDPQYACLSLLGAVDVRNWYDRVCACMVGQAPCFEDGGEGE